MNNNAKAWIAALRSGEYKQGSAQLRRSDDSYCCLGVACDLHAKATGKEWRSRPATKIAEYEGETIALPVAVRDWLGVADPHGQFGSAGEETALSTLNDDGRSFAAIADIIESEPAELFV